MRKLINLFIILPLLLLFVTIACSDGDESHPPFMNSQDMQIRIKLPEPRYDSDVSLEEILVKRRSIRNYSGEPLTVDEVSQLIWAAQGITADWGGRSAPSAGALYPLKVYVAAGNVRDLGAGVYRYEPKRHELVMIADKDMRSQLAGAALGQNPVRNAAINLVFTAVYQRTTQKYGKKGIRYVHIEIGHAAQNVCLQATAMNLGSVTIGAFSEEEISRLLNLPSDEKPLYIIPVGKHH